MLVGIHLQGQRKQPQTPNQTHLIILNDLCAFDTSSFKKSINWMILYKMYCVS